MTSALVIALSIAGFALLVFGERMGLGPQLAAWGVVGIFFLVAVSLALASMTSRLSRFVVGSERSASLGLAAVVAILLLLGAVITGVKDPDISMSGASLASSSFALLVGFFVSYGLVPFNPWRNFVSSSAVGAGPDRDPGYDTGGTVQVLMLAVLLAAILIAVYAFPPTVDRVVRASGWGRSGILLITLSILALISVLGGMFGLARVTKVLIVIALITVVAPFGAFFAGEFLDQFNTAFLRQIGEGGVRASIGALHGVSLRTEWPACVLGGAFGLIALQPATAVRTRTGRLLAIAAGILIALVLGLLAKVGQFMLDDIIQHRIAGVAPAQWPPFVFDETLRGWLSVCGRSPEDPQAAARACFALGQSRAILPPGSILIDQGLAAPALALSLGWPIILGFIWALLVPLFALVAVGLAIHAFASGAAERVLFRMIHPRALRSWRLAMARLLLLVVISALYWLDHDNIRLAQPVFQWALLGAMGVASTAILAFWLIAGMRFVRGKRTRGIMNGQSLRDDEPHLRKL